MPTYEYECKSCKHTWEEIQGIKEPPTQICPKCGNTPNKLLSKPTFILLGSGWAQDNYSKP